jgi:hypothetical protein
MHVALGPGECAIQEDILVIVTKQPKAPLKGTAVLTVLEKVCVCQFHVDRKQT